MKLPGIKLLGAVACVSMLAACGPHPHHPHDGPPPHDCDAMRSPMERDWDAPPPPPAPNGYHGDWAKPIPPHHPCHHGRHDHRAPSFERPAPGMTKEHMIETPPALNADRPLPPRPDWDHPAPPPPPHDEWDRPAPPPPHDDWDHTRRW